jgi:hypothetical protein
MSNEATTQTIEEIKEQKRIKKMRKIVYERCIPFHYATLSVNETLLATAVMKWIIYNKKDFLYIKGKALMADDDIVTIDHIANALIECVELYQINVPRKENRKLINRIVNTDFDGIVGRIYNQIYTTLFIIQLKDNIDIMRAYMIYSRSIAFENQYEEVLVEALKSQGFGGSIASIMYWANTKLSQKYASVCAVKFITNRTFNKRIGLV